MIVYVSLFRDTSFLPASVTIPLLSFLIPPVWYVPRHHTVTEPPPCFTHASGHSLLYLSPNLFHTYGQQFELRPFLMRLWQMVDGWAEAPDPALRSGVCWILPMLFICFKSFFRPAIHLSSTCTQDVSALWESAWLCKILLYVFGHFFADSTKEMTGCLFYTLIVSVEWLVKQKKYPSQYGQVPSSKWLKSSQRLMRSGRSGSDV